MLVIHTAASPPVTTISPATAFIYSQLYESPNESLQPLCLTYHVNHQANTNHCAHYQRNVGPAHHAHWWHGDQTTAR
ncbi:hypothetical protein FD19_GL001671 [Lacticaseibacillus thailandensis DSM 22698 = JCM 13996]|uniref:Uncharacterized protein n=1 Tax=Lacticaseibacillus thailandensis DSM 22698 = JCM 13996 TaxID=1423810 RepID=A0A0R2C5A0_9LACO|nr:hypothetical protein FD19_GL001671 [Lacticaseibacillus thailandensis DSM 22698 = JCM 13996]